MTINRVWAMPSAWTFTIKPIKNLVKKYVGAGIGWIDPFAGKNSPAEITNDLNPEMKTTEHKDALIFLREQDDRKYMGVLLDPPYSLRQISEHYKKANISVTGWHTSAGWSRQIKDNIARIIKSDGICISFGWNSMGLGKKRGFKIIEILLVAHGGMKHDTICVVERKLE